VPQRYSQRAAGVRIGKMNPANTSDGQVLVLEPDEHLALAIRQALAEAAPAAIVDVARSLEEAQRLVASGKPDLFVLDVDATYDLGQEFLYDLRTSHPNARAIILTAVHLAAARERAAGLGAIHFLEKPFPHTDFVDLVHALLRPSAKPESETFQGTLSDLHIADIIQLKCMSGATSAIELTGPTGEKGQVFFEEGQVRHATTPGKQGAEAFNEIVTWKGGMISEIAAGSSPRTIDLDWQVLLMEAMRKVDETGASSGARGSRARASPNRKVLVSDDSLMLLSFVKEILTQANYQVTTAATAAESLTVAKSDPPELILLDYVLPDMKGDEVSRRLREDPATASIRVVYMSGFGTDLKADRVDNPNVIGVLNKPFTSDLLIKTIETHMPKSPDESQSAGPETESASGAGAEQVEPGFVSREETVEEKKAEPEPTQAPEWWSPPEPEASQPEFGTSFPAEAGGITEASFLPADASTASVEESNLPNESVTGGAYFCGDTRFFSLNWALQTIAKGKLTGSLRSFWNKEPVDLLAQNGQIVLVTTRDPELYCPEAPITLVNVDAERIMAARATQRESGCPLFLTLAQENLILREPAVQLVQHYGQKLFAQLWTARRVRFVFEQNATLPSYASDIPGEPDIDNWTLATLRLIQFQDLGDQANYDPAFIPAYTRDGFERVQNLRLTVAEAQFASQFNGVRSIQQIAKNLRLDLKFARLTLFRFLALEIVECWPPTPAAKAERKGVLQRLTRSIGIGE
jgi:DNA-binding response OmpR family regulator